MLVEPSDGDCITKSALKRKNRLIFRRQHHVASTSLKHAFDEEDGAMLEKLVKAFLDAVALGQPENVGTKDSTDKRDYAIFVAAMELDAFISGGNYKLADSVFVELLQPLYELTTESDLLVRSVQTWRVVSTLFRNIVTRRESYHRRPPATVNVLPLYDFIRNVVVVSKRVRHTNIQQSALHQIKDVMHDIGRTVSLVVPYEALATIWEREKGWMPHCDNACGALGMLTMFLPRREDPPPPEFISLLQEIVEFLIESFKVTRNGGWILHVWDFLESVAYCYQNRVEWTKMAEPLFTSILFMLKLPAGNSADQREKMQVAQDGLSSLTMQVTDGIAFSIAKQGTFLGNVLPNDTTNPLWSHLRRFIRYVEPFLRPTAASKSHAQRVIGVIGLIVDEVRRRLKVQLKYPDTVANESILSTESVEELVKLLLKPLLNAIYFRASSVSEVSRIALQKCLLFAPQVVLPHMLRGLETALGVSTAKHQAHNALRGLSGVNLILAATKHVEQIEQVREFLKEGDALSRLISMIDANEVEKSIIVIGIFFEIGASYRFSDFFPDEQEGVMEFLEKVLTFSKDLSLVSSAMTSFFYSFRCFFAGCSRETLQLVMERVARAVRERGTQAYLELMSHFLCAVVTCYSDETIAHIVPLLAKSLSDPYLPKSDLNWDGTLLCAATSANRRPPPPAIRAHFEKIIEVLEHRPTNLYRVTFSGAISKSYIFSFLVTNIDYAAPDQDFGGEGAVAAEGCRPFFTVKDVKHGIPWNSPNEEELAYVVGYVNRKLKRFLSVLTNPQEEVERLLSKGIHRSRSHVSTCSLEDEEGASPLNDDDEDDEEITSATLTRYYLRQLADLMDGCVLLFISDARREQRRAGEAASSIFNDPPMVAKLASSIPEIPDGVELEYKFEDIQSVLLNVVYPRVSDCMVRTESRKNTEEDSVPTTDVRAIDSLLVVLARWYVSEIVQFRAENHDFLRVWQCDSQGSMRGGLFPKELWAILGEIQNAARLDVVPVFKKKEMAELIEFLTPLSGSPFASLRQASGMLMLKVFSFMELSLRPAILGKVVTQLESATEAANDWFRLSQGTDAVVSPSTLTPPGGSPATPSLASQRPQGGGDPEEELFDLIDPSTLIKGNKSESDRLNLLRELDAIHHKMQGILGILSDVYVSRELLTLPQLRRRAIIGLINFPDVLRPDVEEFRKNAFNQLCSELKLRRVPMDEFLYEAEMLLALAVKVIARHPTRAQKCLTAVANTFHRSYSQCISPVALGNIVQLACHSQNIVRKAAFNLLKDVFISMKVKTPKKALPFLLESGELNPQLLSGGISYVRDGGLVHLPATFNVEDASQPKTFSASQQALREKICALVMMMKDSTTSSEREMDDEVLPPWIKKLVGLMTVDNKRFRV